MSEQRLGYNFQVRDLNFYKECIFYCKRLGLVCDYNSYQTLPELSSKISTGLRVDNNIIVDALRYAKRKYLEIINCNLICGVLITYQTRPIVFMGNNNYKEQFDDSIICCDLSPLQKYSRL